MPIQDIEKKASLEKWVREYGDELYSWAFYKTSNQFTAEDLVQETFLAACKSFEKYKGDSTPKTWLFSILKYKIIDHYRSSAKSFLSFDTLLEKQAFEITEKMFDEDKQWVEDSRNTFWKDDTHLLDDPDFNNTLEECLIKLPGNWKVAVLSKYIADKDSKDICQELDITPTNYWQVLHRAKLMLKKCIELNWFKK